MFIRKIKSILKWEWYKYQVDHCPKNILSTLWRKRFGNDINWEHPCDLNEKIQWLQVYSDTSEWSRLSDKYLCREFIKERGYEHLLVKLLGVYHNAEEIDYDALPDKFVLKCNHDSGSTHIIDKKKGFDKNAINSDLNQHLRHKFGYVNCEPHYNKIKPLIIAEEFLEDDKTSFSSTAVDYKVWSFNGKPHIVWAAYNRSKQSIVTESYDLNWNFLPDYYGENKRYLRGKGVVPKPICLKEMIRAAADLSKGFPQVRVDFYEIKGRLYFGEMTFTSDCGRMPFFSKEALEEMGDLVDLSTAQKK